MYRTLVKFDIDEDRDKILENLMRGPVSKALGIPSNVVWGSQSGSTFSILMGDFMKPAVDIGKYVSYAKRCNKNLRTVNHFS